MPPEVEVGRGFDGDAYARRLRDSGADGAVAFCKCHYGFAYYPTRVGTPHPRLACDLLGETVRGLHRHGLAASGYFSVLLNTQAAEQHPEWRLRGDQSTSAGFDSGRYPRLCVNTGYADFFIAHCVEAVEQYPVDDLLLDTMPGFKPCYCPACRAAFGRDIPAGPEADGWLTYARWYADCFERFYDRATAAIRRVRPLPVLWNHRWTYSEPELPAESTGRMVTDRIASPGWASIDSRYFGGTGQPFEYMCGRFAHGLGEWNSNYQGSLDLTAAESCAHGGTFWLIDRQLPDGGLEDRAWRNMADTFAPVQARRTWLEGTSQVYETAVLASIDHILAPDRRYFPQGEVRKVRARPIEAALGYLAEHGRLGHAMPRERLLDRLPELRLVILPDVAHLDDATVDRLLPWVEAGGRILATMPPDGPTGPLARLAGVVDAGRLDSTHAFIAGADPLLLRGPWHRLRPLPGTTAIADLLLPLLPRYGHGVAPPGASAGCPAATQRTLGNGAVLLVASPVWATWWEWASPGLETQLAAWLDLLLPKPLARVDHPGQVELACQRQGRDLILHVLNRCGRTRLGGWYYPMMRFTPPLADVPLRLRSRTPPRLTLEPGGIPLPTTPSADGTHTAIIPRLESWQVVVAHDHDQGIA